MKSRTTPVRRAARLLGWLALLGATLAWLLAAPGLPGPPADRSAAGLSAWLADAPASAGMAVLRGAALAATGWLLLLTLVGVMASAVSAAATRRPGRARLARGAGTITALVDRASLGLVRRVLLPATGAALAVLPAAPAGASAVHAAPPVVASTGWAVIRPLAVDRPAGAAAVATVAGGGMATIVQLPGDEAAPAPAGALPQDPEPALPPPPMPTPAAKSTWVVAPGDHLWSIAEARLAESLGRPPTEAEVRPYWRAVLGANRDRLVDPDVPDLLFAGQELTLPPPPAAG